MGTFTLAGNARFGATNDSVDVEVRTNSVVLVHYGSVDASRRGSNHKGLVQSWTVELEAEAIRSFNKEVVSSAWKAEKPRLFGKLLGSKPAPSKLQPAEGRCILNIEVRGQPCVVVLRGALSDVDDLEHALHMLSNRERKQRLLGI